MRMKQKIVNPPPRVEEMRQAAADIRRRIPGVIVAAIGAADPDVPYKLKMGMKAGYELSKFVHESNSGTLITGGMGGVGTDIFVGVTKYRLSKPEFDRFFVLIPERVLSGFFEFVDYAAAFQEDSAYSKLAALTDSMLIRERAGNDLEERRICLAHTADLAICFNGTGGTLDEAAMMIAQGKPVIACEETGGISELLLVYKYFVEKNKSTFDLKYLKRVAAALPVRFDPELIVETATVDEAIEVTKRMMKQKGGVTL